MTCAYGGPWIRGSRFPVGGHWAASQFSGDGVDPINDDDVLTVAELKERTHIEESDELLKSYISAARQQVERDTGCALPQQTIAVGYDRIDPAGIYLVPMPPLQAVVSVQVLTTDGNSTQLDPDTIIESFDALSMPARLTFKPGAFDGFTLVPLSGLFLNCTVGWPKAFLPPLLKFAVGLLASHYATFGRDLATVDSVVSMPMGYESAIQGYRLETGA